MSRRSAARSRLEGDHLSRQDRRLDGSGLIDDVEARCLRPGDAGDLRGRFRHALPLPVAEVLLEERHYLCERRVAGDDQRGASGIEPLPLVAD